jgi:hypothetical protein
MSNPGKSLAAHHAPSGRLLMRRPVSAKIALAIAGATGDTGGSPSPDGG